MNVKKKKILISVASCAAALAAAAALVCGLAFGLPRGKGITCAERLAKISALYKQAVCVRDRDGAAVSSGMLREIEITQNGETVALYSHSLIVEADGEKVTASLCVRESYPADERSDVAEEYYLDGGVMHARRVGGGTAQISEFSSGIDALLTLSDEKTGVAEYGFDEAFFRPADGGDATVFGENGLHVLRAAVMAERYKDFFGKAADVAGITDVTVEAAASEDKFIFMTVKYEKNGFVTEIKATNQAGKKIEKPLWAD